MPAAAASHSARDQRLRLGLVIGQLTYGGAESQLYELARGLGETCDVTVYCMSSATEPYGPRLEAAGVRVRSFPAIGRLDPTRVLRLASSLRSDGIELVHAFLFIGSAYAYLATRFLSGVRLVTSARNCKPEPSRLRRFVLERAFRSSHAIVCNSAEMARFAARYYGAPNDRLDIVYNGVDTERFAAAAPDPSRQIVGTIGRIERQKNLDLFLDAAAILRERFPAARFVIVGDGSLRPRLEERVRADGLADAVRFAGNVEDVPALLAGLGQLWLTSDWEGTPNVVLEAMAAGLPVVATRVGGTPRDRRGRAHRPAGRAGRCSRLRGGGGAFVGGPGAGRRRGRGRSSGRDPTIFPKGDDRLDQCGIQSRAEAGHIVSARPTVTVIIPMRNERDWIGRCLDSVFGQDYPGELLDVIVVDGMSDDGSQEILSELAASEPRLRVLQNPARIVPSSLNRAIGAATGDIIARVDSHTLLATDYISVGVETLQRTGADNVGGPMVKLGGGKVGDAIAAAMGSRFGVGSYFQYGSEEREADTVYMGMWPREVFERVGLFDEELVRNQDDEFNYRLRKHGGRIVVNPRMRSRYQNRQSWSKLARQFYEYGLWKARVLQKHPAQMSIRHYVPPGFDLLVLAGLASAPLGPLGPLLSAGAICAYLVVVAAVAATLPEGSGGRFRLVLAFVLIHHAWAIGFLVGMVRFAHRWFKPERPEARLAGDLAGSATRD